ncbi:type VII secretion-associated serine protease mycosin [Lentzea flaviverrucosa]|uniref:Type VII secretion-associated serine protease mycosin n=1 Tax=Lentzea flaviverrucosa TaxID=200379 RepID=A0A1H9Q8F6_9PSEU|nr:type VII secretion-associated serine protease mycosin [Lentzea flaviverrucosa]RDI29610.1 type VII secretion-associated serine protease mycosin [Lentzea flaviverrucosa]SER56179.1 type VII secretion-associated serine protease mycosin [Lentzea flaviverrucosa]
MHLVSALAVALPLLLAAQTIEEQEWHLDALDVYSAQSQARGDGVIVAVIDSGVDAQHPDLVGQVLPGAGFGRSKGTDGTTDVDGHGTGMAGIIAATGRDGGALGIAPGAKILPIASADEKEQFGLDVVAESIRWAADHGAKVVNMSLGFSSSMTPTLVKAVNYAIEKDVVLVAATGNDGKEVSAPANINGVIAVAGTTREGKPWAASNVGTDTVLAAPAAGIVTIAPQSVYASGYAEMDGTSAASAIVSGVAALVRAKHPDMAAKDVVNALVKTATDLAEPGRDAATGFGMVNPMGALTAQLPPVERNPLLPPSPSTTQPTPALTAQRPQQPVDVEDRLPFVAAVAGGTAVMTGLLIALPAIRSRRPKPVSARDTPPTPW